MIGLKREDFVFLAGRAEKAGTLHWDWQASLFDDSFAGCSVEAPFHQRIPVDEEMPVEPGFAGFPSLFTRSVPNFLSDSCSWIVRIAGDDDSQSTLSLWLGGYLSLWQLV